MDAARFSVSAKGEQATFGIVFCAKFRCLPLKDDGVNFVDLLVVGRYSTFGMVEGAQEAHLPEFFVIPAEPTITFFAASSSPRR